MSLQVEALFELIKGLISDLDENPEVIEFLCIPCLCPFLFLSFYAIYYFYSNGKRKGFFLLIYLSILTLLSQMLITRDGTRAMDGGLLTSQNFLFIQFRRRYFIISTMNLVNF